jgi:hypothetical protein
MAISKKEAREIRKALKAVAASEKRVRFLDDQSQVEPVKQPRSAHENVQGRTARFSENPSSIMSMRFRFELFTDSDREGQWSWGQARNWCLSRRDAGKTCEMRSTLDEIGQLTWDEIFAQTTGGKKRRKKHHSQDVSSLCPEAIARWEQIGRGEEELFRFRTGNKKRIWGIRERELFKVIWWDTEHKIYPVD